MKRWLVVCLSFTLIRCEDTEPETITLKNDLPTPSALEKRCEDIIGKPRVKRVSDHLWVATGYDLANVILIKTPVGNVFVDTGMSKKRARRMRRALQKAAPGPTKAIIFTHTHIDHVGGAAAFADKDTEIWAHASFEKNFFEQYGLFRKTEVIRAGRMYGVRVDDDELPCSAIGRRVDLKAALKSGAMMPTHTFTERKTLDFGGMKIELVHAPGETHDQLFVYIPSEKALLPGDNIYSSFPNLYTIRGTTPRPVSAWISSLDRMRAREPEILVPSHTQIIKGKIAVANVLRDYRDAIQWVRDETIRGANSGKTADELAESIALPKHLADKPYLEEHYGQIDWSVRGIFASNLGWFGGNAVDLYPLKTRDLAQREIDLMGGPKNVRKAAKKARKKGDFQWASHLLNKLRQSLSKEDDLFDDVEEDLVEVLRDRAAEIGNTNGRGYLFEYANEMDDGPIKQKFPDINKEIVASISLETIFELYINRLKPAGTLAMHESIKYEFTDIAKSYYVTIRQGVAEVVADTPLPGTPEPLATLSMSTKTFREIATRKISKVVATARGDIKISGSKLGLVSFQKNFDFGKD